MKHYVCAGDCRGVSEKPTVCGAAVCEKKGQPLAECDCADQKHHPMRDKKGKEARGGEEKNN